jgi:very-short-patch-repair endonuclease/16S rRNA G966 N2-methylase RsmD
MKNTVKFGENLESSFEGKLNELRSLMPFLFDGEGNLLENELKNFIKQYKGTENNAQKFTFEWAGKQKAKENAFANFTSGALQFNEARSKNPAETGNMIIEGDNLSVLHLLNKSYKNKVKCIYIDPPYNTGNDFVYNDKFELDIKSYLIESGQIDGETGEQIADYITKDDGKKHSKWLSFMYPRLLLARDLLTEDGVIFISIDDNEVANLKLMMNEIFGEENFVADIIWNSTKSVTNTALISVSHTHNIVYFKDKTYFTENRTEFRLPDDGDGFSNPDNDPRGDWKADPFQVGGWRPNQQYEIINPKTGISYRPNTGSSWKNDYITFQKLLEENRIVFGVNGDSAPQRKRFLTEALERGKVAKTLWDDVETTTNATQKLKDLMDSNVFDNPKPVSLIKRILELSTNPNDIVLDFFAGSGTTGQAVMELNFEEMQKLGLHSPLEGESKSLQDDFGGGSTSSSRKGKASSLANSIPQTTAPFEEINKLRQAQYEKQFGSGSHSPLEGESKSLQDDFGGGSTSLSQERKYNTKHTELARNLRKNQTETESLLWSKLSNKSLNFKFRRQQPIGDYIVDFICFETKLIIELDGSGHLEKQEEDFKRDNFLKEQGFRVLRLWNNEFLENIEGTLTLILELCNNPKLTPHQNSSGILTPPQVGSVPKLAGGRKFILVQLPEKIDEKKEAFKAGYKHISEITIERVKRAGEKYKGIDTGFKTFELTSNPSEESLFGLSSKSDNFILNLIALFYGYGLNHSLEKLEFGNIYKMKSEFEEKTALIILEDKTLSKEIIAKLIALSESRKNYTLFAKEVCINIEITYNLCNHFKKENIIRL